MTEWDPLTESFDVERADEPSEPDYWPEPCDWSWGNEDPNALEWWVVTPDPSPADSTSNTPTEETT